MRISRSWLAALAGAVLLSLPLLTHAAEVIRPRVMVVATYEVGSDRGDTPGELQYWVEREKLDQSIVVPGIDHPLLTNGKGLYAMISGTSSRCALQLVALAMDPRFDLRKTYFLMDGIAGSDPTQLSLGSAAWIKCVVDGDHVFAIDSRDAPAAWPYGLVAFGATKANEAPPHIDSVQAAGVADDGSGRAGSMVVYPNPALTDWAYHLTSGTKLGDTPELDAMRPRFKDDAAAQLLPHVVEATSLGTDHYWHGTALNQWARDWVRIYTRGKEQFAITDSEDQGFCFAMQKLDLLGRADFKRCLVLRTVAGYSVPLPGVTAEQSLFGNEVVSAAYIPSLDACYRVGDVVVEEILNHWSKYENQLPK